MLANWVQSLTEVAFKNSNSCISQNSFTNHHQQFSWTHNLINIFTGSPSWNTLHHGQTIHSPTENLISLILFKTPCIIFELLGYGKS